MAEEIRHPDGRIEHPSVRSEKSDADFRWVFRLIVAAAVLGVIILWAVWRFFIGTSDQLTQVRRSSYPLAPGPSTALPQKPRLEQLDRMVGDPRSNVWIQQKAHEDRLAGYRPGPTLLIAQFIAAQGLVSPEAPSPGVPRVAVALWVAPFDTSALAATWKKGFVQIPLKRAVEYLATTKKLPARDEKAQAVPRDNGLVGGGEPNSGRLFNRRKPRWLGP
jgi:hypothetical protein